MIAIDTNILVRFLVKDHPQQSASARRLIESSEIFLSRTVLLEAVWVLGSAYALSSDDILAAIADVLDLEGTTIEDRALVSEAVRLARAGMQFADAMHLVATPEGASFVTFDRELWRSARAAKSAVSVRRL